MSADHDETSLGETPPSSIGRNPLTVTSRRVGKKALVRAVGDVDYSTAPALSEAIREAVRGEGPRPQPVAVDLADVRFLDSSGVSTLIESKLIIEDAGGSLTLVNPSRAVSRTLELAGLSQMFDL